MFKKIRAYFLIDDIKTILEDGEVNISTETFNKIYEIIYCNETTNIDKLKVVRHILIRDNNNSREFKKILDRINSIC